MIAEIKKLVAEVKPHKRKFIIVLIAGVFYAAATARSAYIIKPLFDNLAQANFDKVLDLVPIALGLALIAGVSRYFHIYLMNYLTECVGQSIRLKLQKKFLRLNLTFHNGYDNGSGGLISRILNDIKSIQDGLRAMADIFIQPLLFIALLTNLFILDWKLTLGTFIIVPFIVLLVRTISKSLRKYIPMGQVVLEKMTSTIKETLDGVRVIQSFNLEKEMAQKLENESDEYLEIRRKVHSRAEAMGPITEFIATIIIMCVLLYTTYEVSQGRSSPGSFIAFVTSLIALNQPIKRVQEAYVRAQEVIVSTQRVYSIIESKEEVPESSFNREFPLNWNNIIYKNVSFSYGHSQILKNINLEIKRGEIVALVGASGSGKSTIVNLLERFFDATHGEILIDDVNIQDLSLKELRRNVALVNQDVFLFSDTIERNIWAGDYNRTNHDVMPMAKLANAHEFIMKMPHEYQSRVGDRGNLLSGGEKQRISIARALFKNAPLLILDEATSALDTGSEIEVQKGLDHLMSGRTALVIAHRLSTIQKADKIVVLKEGQIVEVGTHKTLLENNGEYSKFHRMQHS